MFREEDLKFLKEFNDRPIIAIIPARGGSTRINKKNLQDLNGNSLLRKSVITCLESNIFTHILVSTDSHEIENEVSDLGIKIHKRSSVNSNSFASTEDVINEIFNDYKSINFDNSILYLIQCTSPFLEPRDLQNSKNMIFDKKSFSHSLLSGYLTSKFIWESNPKSQFWDSKNYDPLCRPRSQDSSKYFVENGAFYVFSTHNYKISKCRLHGNVDIYPMDELRSIDIDYERDLEFSRHLFNFLYP